MSLKKEKLSLWLIAGVLVFLAVAAVVIYKTGMRERAMVQVGSTVFTVDVARTEPELERGLGGTVKLGDHDGLLMVFDHEDKWAIWMKDMNVPIDIIWINEAKKVVFVQPNVDSATYPEKFIPSASARYVLEVASGSAARAGIRTGTAVQIMEDHKGKGEQ